MLEREIAKTDPSVAPGVLNVAVRIAIIVYEKFTGNAYSEEEIYLLSELRRVYGETIQESSPVQWELDKDNRPTHCIKQKNWALLVRQLRQNKHSIGHFYSQSSIIAEYAETYLTLRSERRVGGSGKPGDLVEQFLGEWINFALNDLPMFEFNQTTLETLEKRIHYIDQIQKHPSLFKFSFISREKNKADAIESIRNALESCLELAKLEIVRKCAREELDACYRKMEALLLSSVQVLYYARETATHHEPLNPEIFLDENSGFVTKVAKALYPKLRNTHSGAMLHEIIARAGLESFGEKTVKAYKNNIVPQIYFDDNFEPLVINGSSKKFDLPAWTESEVEQFKGLQEFGASILRVALLNKLVQQAYDLAGKVGDEWVYGDQKGRKCLSALLYLLNNDLEKLYHIFNQLYGYHDSKRRASNLENRVDPDADVNRNFNKVDANKIQINDLCKELKRSIDAIRAQLAQYPKESIEQLNERKQLFYSSVLNYFRRFYPQEEKNFNLKMNVSDSKDLTDLEDKVTVEIKLPLSPTPIHNLKFPIKEDKNCKGYWYYDKLEFNDYCYKDLDKNKVTRKIQWRLGNNYSDWMKEFFTRHYNLFNQYHQAIELLYRQPSSITLETIRVFSKNILEKINLIKETVNNEEPQWRFKLSLWPIKTKGWPFNRKAKEFSEKVMKELMAVECLVTKEIKNTEERIKIGKKIQTEELEETLDLTPDLKEVAERISDPNERQITIQAWSKSQREWNQAQAIMKRHNLLLEEETKEIETKGASSDRKSVVKVDADTISASTARVIQGITTKNEVELKKSNVLSSHPMTSEGLIDLPGTLFGELLEQKCQEYIKLNVFLFNKIIAWQENENKDPFILFYNINEVKAYMKLLLSFRDVFPAEHALLLVEDCCEISELIEPDTRNNKIDPDSRDQALLLNKMLSVVMTTKNSVERREKESEFNAFAMQVYQVRIPRNASIRGYSLFNQRQRNNRFIENINLTTVNPH